MEKAESNLDKCVEIGEIDFYPPKDDRKYFDLTGRDARGDTYEDYIVWFWREYEDEIYG